MMIIGASRVIRMMIQGILKSDDHRCLYQNDDPGNTKGGSITVLLTSRLTGLDQSVLQIKTKIVSCHKAHSKPVKQEANGTLILPLQYSLDDHRRCNNLERHSDNLRVIIYDRNMFIIHATGLESKHKFLAMTSNSRLGQTER